MNENTIDIVGNIIVPFVTVLASAFITLKISDKKEKTKICEEEKRKVEIAIKEFRQDVIGEHMDILNDGKAYSSLEGKKNSKDIEMNFVKKQEYFKDEIQYYCNSESIKKYNLIKDFYDSKVFGKSKDCEFVFADDYIKLIEALQLDKEMIQLREEINTRVKG